MKTSRTPKIVIGVCVVAVYAAILSAVILREGRPGAVAANAPDAPQEYSATDAVASAADAPLPTDPVTTATEQPVAAPESTVAPPEEKNVIAHSPPATPAATVRGDLATAQGETSPASTSMASEPETASIATEVPAAAPPSEETAGSDSPVATDVNDEGVSPLVVGN